jgi:hypothetical protein
MLFQNNFAKGLADALTTKQSNGLATTAATTGGH